MSYLYRNFLFVFCLSAWVFGSDFPEGSYIGYSRVNGRFGDQLTHYVRAKWVSYKTGMPVAFSPFKYSDQLALSQHESALRKSLRFSSVKRINSLDQSFLNDNPNTLYVVPYFSAFDYEFERANAVAPPGLQIDWSDKQFIALLRELIKPIDPLELVKPPEGVLSIAVHYRTGEGYDSDVADRIYPLKFPPIGFYAEQIQYIYELLGQPPLYVYIFTDHPKPKDQVVALKNLVNIDTIQWDYNPGLYRRHVLQDFFSFQNFDCFIYPASYFSLIPAFLGDFQVVITPRTYHYVNRKLIVDSCDIRIAQPDVLGEG